MKSKAAVKLAGLMADGMRVTGDFFSDPSSSNKPVTPRVVGINGVSSPTGTRSAAPPSQVLDYSKYNGAKNISSEKFFGDEPAQEAESKATMGKYSTSNAISSSDYFNEGGSDGGDGSAFIDRLSLQARQDLNQVKSIASNVSRKLGDMAGSLMRDLGKY